MFAAPPRPELLALLAAVKADPDDDTAKLVLADWLQEQDAESDRARGEFLRELVRYNRLRRDDPDYAAAHERLNALWDRHAAAWVGPLSDAGFQCHWTGYSCPEWGMLFPHIDGAKVVAKEAVALAGSEAYAWVAGLYFRQTSGSQLLQFANSPLLDSLTGLTLSRCRVSGDSLADVVNSPAAAALRRLALENVPVPAAAIAASPRMARLRELHLSQTQIGDAGFKALCDSPHLNELRSLTISSWDSLTLHSGRSFADATGLPALTELEIGRTNHIGPDGTLILVHKPAAGRLRKLGLSSNGVADYGVEAICRAPHMCNLTHLDVSENLLTDRAALAVADAEHLKTLEELSLRRNDITDEGATALADAPHLANLRRIDLSDNRVGAKAADRLRERFGNRVVLE